MSQDLINFLQSSTSSQSDFLKLNDGEAASFRLLSAPIVGMEVFVDNKPHRWSPSEQPPAIDMGDERPKKFLAFIVYQYSHEDGKGAVKVWSFSQKTIRENVINAFQWNAVSKKFRHHWGAFEMNLTRTGKALATTYALTVVQRPIEKELAEFAKTAEEYIDLSRLYHGEMPFIQDLPTIHLQPEEQSDSDALPF
jgi:hypothetical protein